MKFQKNKKNTRKVKFNSFELKNAAVASQLVDGNIYLGLACGNELGEDLQDEVRKSMIGAYLSLSKHNKMFFNGGIDDTLEELEDKLYAKFLEYIRKVSINSCKFKTLVVT